MVDVYVDSNDNNRFNESDDTFTPDKGSEKTNGKFTSSVVVNEGDIANVDLSVVKGGKKVAIPLLDKDGNMIDDKDAVRRIKVKAEWKVGELSEKPEIEFVKIGAEYAYAVTFTLPESAEIKTTDLAGKIAVYESSSQLKDNYSDKEYITLSFGSEYGFKTEDYDGSDLAKAEVVDFDDYSDDVETLTFGDDFEFEVDLSGQGKLNLKNNRDFNKEFAAMYDYANIDFINFVKTPSFNKNGTVYIYADEDAYIYEVTADGAKEIKGLKWDEDYEAWTFKTRTLKSYAISDVELTEKTVTEDKDDTTTDGGKENPDTGR
ncbi:MAG TPA: hypothetical protein H9678_06330 [Firmicutes bacterium]|nr:hypothetical protein [Bacillota bacterium]